MVAETLSANGNGHSANNWRTTVDFPAPDGPEMMTSLPGEGAFIGRGGLGSGQGFTRSKVVRLERLFLTNP